MSTAQKEYSDEIRLIATTIATMFHSLSGAEIPLKKNPAWTVEIALAHLVISQQLAKKVLMGEKNPYKNAEPETISAANARLLSAFAERNGDTLATMLVKDTDAFLKIVNAREDNAIVKTHIGTMDTLTVLSYNLYHLLTHGSQIASTLNKSLFVTKKRALLCIPILKQAMVATYDKETAKDIHAVFVIELRNTTRFAVFCNGGQIKVTEKLPQKADCYISADTISFLLISMGVISQWESFLRGKLSIKGRKPWLALKFSKLFKTP